MAQESQAASGKRFARDMKRVRESRRLTVDDLHDETKIPLGLLEAFEETALFDHPQFNRVYLRSFVRTYANVLGIDPDVAIQSLEEALSDRYDGALGRAYLDERQEESIEAESAEIAGSASAAAAETKPADRRQPETGLQSEDTPISGKKPPSGGVSEADEIPQRQKSSRAADRPVHSGKPAPEEAAAEEPDRRGDAAQSAHAEEDEPSSPAYVSTTGATAAGYEGSQAGEADEAQWNTQSPPSAKQDTGGRTPYRKRSDGGSWRWIAGVAAVIVVGVVVWIIVSVTGGGPLDAQEMTSVADTAETVDTMVAPEAADTSPGPMPTLGDTMNVQIVAANEKVDPIRVTVDDDLRRPYWLELGDSMTFRPTNRIVIEEDLDNIELSIEGAAYPTNRRDEAGRIVITRDSLRNYFTSNSAD